MRGQVPGALPQYDKTAEGVTADQPLLVKFANALLTASNSEAMDQMGPPVHLRHMLRNIVREPVKTLVPPWSWKAGAFAAAVRGAAFFLTNLQAEQGDPILTSEPAWSDDHEARVQGQRSASLR